MQTRLSLLATPALAVSILLPAIPAQAIELGDPPTFPAYQPPAPEATLAATAAAGLSVATAQREAVRNLYNALYLASDNAPMGWTGSIVGCNPGTTSQAYRKAVVLRINVIRALAGVPAAVTLDSGFNAKAQQAALMMSANKQLNHKPPSTWGCYSADGAEAAGKSNLALGNAGPGAIAQGYLADPGSNNAAAGHRRWLLYPQTQQMGTGDVAGDATHPPANALWIQDGHLFNIRPPTRNGFVAWPPPGYTPYPLAFARWSLSYPDADFSQATVSMSRNGAAVPTKLEPIANGYGENTLVWLPTDPLLTDPAPLAGTDAVFSVSVQNVKINGQARAFSYKVKLFDPLRRGADTVLPTISGSAQPTVGQNNSYSIAGKPPLSNGYDWLYAKSSPYTAVQGAENGLGKMLAATSQDYPVIADGVAAIGTKSYHLNHSNNCTEQTLTLNQTLVPSANAVLKFYSRLGLASTEEVAAVQISLVDSNQWKDIYTQAGATPPGGAADWGEQTFALRSIPLKAYSGKLIKLRFNFKQANHCYLPGLDIGWYIDNVALTGATAVATPKIKAATAAGAFTFNPPSQGQYVLGARGKIKGYPLEWGGIKTVNAVP